MAIKIQIFSDTHLEHRLSDGTLPTVAAEVCIVAGDLCGHAQLESYLRDIGSRYAKVFYVPGDHEFFNTTVDQLHRDVKLFCPQNVEYLYPGKVVTYEGQRFLGCTLWFSEEQNPEHKTWILEKLSALKYIHATTYEALVTEGRKHRRWLAEACRSGDIVVTHHLPTNRSVGGQWQGYYANSTKVNQCDDIITSARPSLWVHGHSHSRFNYTYGETRIISNPIGYPHEHPSVEEVVIWI